VCVGVGVSKDGPMCGRGGSAGYCVCVCVCVCVFLCVCVCVCVHV